jgi:hypothetical protein
MLAAFGHFESCESERSPDRMCSNGWENKGRERPALAMRA